MSEKQIVRYMHCAECERERPVNKSQGEFARLEVGLTETGIQVWCRRHRREVAAFTPEDIAALISNMPPCDCCPGGKHVRR